MPSCSSCPPSPGDLCLPGPCWVLDFAATPRASIVSDDNLKVLLRPQEGE